MPVHKLADVCHHPEHNPPRMRVFKPGSYEHTCPRCGKTTIFIIPRASL